MKLASLVILALLGFDCVTVRAAGDAQNRYLEYAEKYRESKEMFLQEFRLLFPQFQGISPQILDQTYRFSTDAGPSYLHSVRFDANMGGKESHCWVQKQLYSSITISFRCDHARGWVQDRFVLLDDLTWNRPADVQCDSSGCRRKPGASTAGPVSFEKSEHELYYDRNREASAASEALFLREFASLIGQFRAGVVPRNLGPVTYSQTMGSVDYQMSFLADIQGVSNSCYARKQLYGNINFRIQCSHGTDVSNEFFVLGKDMNWSKWTK